MGLLLLFASLYAVYVAYFRYQQENPQISIEILGEAPIKGINPSATSAIGDPPRIKVPEEPAIGRTLYVSARTGASGHGTFQQPLRNFQKVVCELQPGDRLLVMAGVYSGPFIIGKDCANGTPEAPIELFFADDAVFGGDEGSTASNNAVITIQRSHWHLAGVEIQPVRSLDGLVIGPGVDNVSVEGAHIYSGLGNGIKVGAGSKNITISRSHLHQLGTLEGRSNTWVHGKGAGILVESGTDGVVLRNNRIHNVLGEAIKIITNETTVAATNKVTAPLLENNMLSEDQEKWY